MPIVQKRMLGVSAGQVACSPPESTAIKTEIERGFARAAQKTQLLGLDVVLPSGSYSPGDRVFVAHEHTTSEWIKRPYTLGDKTFVLVPESAVLVSEQTVNEFSLDAEQTVRGE